MINIAILPTVNATLNATSGVLLVLGYACIRTKRVAAHATCMIAAVIVSLIFLASYITYHVLKQQLTGKAHTEFSHPGPIRAIYLSILISHLILAIATVPLVSITLYRALRGRFDRHVRIARWTFPIWLYVSVTGVIVYVMLYHLYPAKSFPG